MPAFPQSRPGIELSRLHQCTCASATSVISRQPFISGFFELGQHGNTGTEALSKVEAAPADTLVIATDAMSSCFIHKVRERVRNREEQLISGHATRQLLHEASSNRVQVSRCRKPLEGALWRINPVLRGRVYPCALWDILCLEQLPSRERNDGCETNAAVSGRTPCDNILFDLDQLHRFL
jgi:hypothetical protein